jgi:hypothetical protein
MGKICDGGRDREGPEPVEYCDRRFLDAYDIGRGSVLLRPGGEVINGGSAGWLGFAPGEASAGDEFGDGDDGDMTSISGSQGGNGSRIDEGPLCVVVCAAGLGWVDVQGGSRVVTAPTH